jgi:hypothetical protein
LDTAEPVTTIERMAIPSRNPARVLRQPESARPDLYACIWGWDFENKRYASGRLALYEELEDKAGFRWWQLRWPKGSGEDSGRWRYEGGSNRQAPGARPASPTRGGHHYVPREVFEAKDLKLSPEARRVFEERVTGPLRSHVHGNSREHEQYNRAVRELLDRHLETGIRPESMTADQARRFLDQVLQSRDPRIRDFNIGIFKREFQYLLRRGPRLD